MQKPLNIKIQEFISAQKAREQEIFERAKENLLQLDTNAPNYKGLTDQVKRYQEKPESRLSNRYEKMAGQKAIMEQAKNFLMSAAWKTYQINDEYGKTRMIGLEKSDKDITLDQKVENDRMRGAYPRDGDPNFGADYVMIPRTGTVDLSYDVFDAVNLIVGAELFSRGDEEVVKGSRQFGKLAAMNRGGSRVYGDRKMFSLYEIDKFPVRATVLDEIKAELIGAGGPSKAAPKKPSGD